MTIENAEQAAAEFMYGRVEECREWCVPIHRHEVGPNFAAVDAAQRTAAVALELVYEKSTVRNFLRMMADPYLRMMAGQKETT